MSSWKQNSCIKNILLLLVSDNTSLGLGVEGFNESRRLFNVQEGYEFNTYPRVCFNTSLDLCVEELN
jgi:hypothetical protein